MRTTLRAINIKSELPRRRYLPKGVDPGDGDIWMYHVNAVRHAATSFSQRGAFPNSVPALIDEEHRRA